jgi:DNA polymerase/3'-5' exonuclease PolX
MPHREALVMAEAALNALKPYTEKMLMAGSIRRLKPEVRDIEPLAILTPVPAGLFGDVLEVDPDFCAVVRRWRQVKGEPTGKYTPRRLPGEMKLDLFIADQDNWGGQLVIRTGSANFNAHVMIPALKARGYRSEEEYIRRAGVVVPTPDETDLWRLSGLPWVEPWAREV